MSREVSRGAFEERGIPYLPQHRRYCELRAEGLGVNDAYVRAGFRPHRGNSNRLERRPEVRNYITRLCQEAAEYAGVRRAAVAIRLDRVGRANIADFFEAKIVNDRIELTLRDITKLPRDLTEAIEAIEAEPETGKLKLKLHDRNQANLALLKMLGGMPEPEPVGVRALQVNIFNALSLDDQAALADLIEALPAGEGEPRPAIADERGAP